MKKTIQKSLMIALVYYSLAIIGCIRCKCQNSENKEFKYKEMALANLQYHFTGDTEFEINNNSSDTIDRKKRIWNQYSIKL